MSKLSIKDILIITFRLKLSRAKIGFAFWKGNKPQHCTCKGDVRYLHATGRHSIPVRQPKPKLRARYFFNIQHRSDVCTPLNSIYSFMSTKYKVAARHSKYSADDVRSAPQ